MTLKPIDFLEFLKTPQRESVGHFICEHDENFRVCESCKGHGVVAKFPWELNGANVTPRFFVETEEGKP